MLVVTFLPGGLVDGLKRIAKLVKNSRKKGDKIDNDDAAHTPDPTKHV
jgi:branched-chain amino acid transport system permease protein